MTQVTVSEEALRELVKEALDGGHLGNLSMPEEEEEPPVKVNPVVDQSAAVTDPINPDFVPQTKPELDVALKQLTKDVPIDNVPNFFKTVKGVLDAEDLENEEDEQMKKAAEGGTTQVEEAIRKAVRNVLGEAPLPPVRKIPYGVHGKEYMDQFQHAKDSLKDRFGKEEEPDVEPEVSDVTPKKRGAYKATAIGNMEDVSGASFQEIAKELGFSVAGAKQAVDKALEKAKFLATGIDSDDLEIMILQTMNEYIQSLNKTGELSPADVQLMKDHPEIVRELDGFREFLATAIKRKRKTGQEVESPIGEHKKRFVEALSSVGMSMDDESPDPYADDPAHQEYMQRGPECPQCGGENTSMNEPVSSMMGHGHDESLHCVDCDQDFAMNPFSGEFGASKGKKSHLATEVSKKKSVMLKCPDCGGNGWDEKAEKADKDCELCAGHGQISKRDLYGEKLVRTALALVNEDGSFGPNYSEEPSKFQLQHMEEDLIEILKLRKKDPSNPFWRELAMQKKEEISTLKVALRNFAKSKKK